MPTLTAAKIQGKTRLLHVPIVIDVWVYSMDMEQILYFTGIRGAGLPVVCDEQL